MFPSASKKVLMRPEQQHKLDCIIEYMKDMTGSIILTSEDKGMHDRMAYAYDHLRNYLPKSDVAKLIKKKFKVSMRTAYNDLDNAQYIHGSVGELNLTFEIKMLLDVSMLNIKMAVEDKDSKALAKAIEARVKILKLVEDDKSIPWELLEPSHYTMIININGEIGKKIDLNKTSELSIETMDEVQKQLDKKFDADLIETLKPVPDEPAS